MERQEDQIVIRVRNTGVGIAAEQCEHVFDIFAQVDTSLQRSLSGLGISLYWSRLLTEPHGGHVEVSSGGVGQGRDDKNRCSQIGGQLGDELIERLGLGGRARDRYLVAFAAHVMPLSKRLALGTRERTPRCDDHSARFAQGISPPLAVIEAAVGCIAAIAASRITSFAASAFLGMVPGLSRQFPRMLGGFSCLLVEYVHQRFVNLQHPVVFDQPQLTKLVHEEVHTRP